MVESKRTKVLFLDIDEVFTTSGKASERRVRPETVMRLTALRASGYDKLAFITARSGNWVMEEFMPYVKKAGLMGVSTFQCENGLYEIANGKFVLSREAEAFAPYRKIIAKAVDAELKAKGVKGSNASEKAGKVVQVRYTPDDKAHAKALGEACQIAVNKLKKAGKISAVIEAEITKSGVNIYPRTMNKGVAARQMEARIQQQTGRKIRGKAIGDKPLEDGLMASGKRIKWRGVNNADEFMKMTAQWIRPGVERANVNEYLKKVDAQRSFSKVGRPRVPGIMKKLRQKRATQPRRR